MVPVEAYDQGASNAPSCTSRSELSRTQSLSWQRNPPFPDKAKKGGEKFQFFSKISLFFQYGIETEGVPKGTMWPDFFFLSFQQILKVLDETSSTHQTRGQTGNDKGISHYLAGSHYDTLETVKPTASRKKLGGKHTHKKQKTNKRHV
jgi:hypothetical protein